MNLIVPAPGWRWAGGWPARSEASPTSRRRPRLLMRPRAGSARSVRRPRVPPPRHPQRPTSPPRTCSPAGPPIAVRRAGDIYAMAQDPEGQLRLGTAGLVRFDELRVHAVGRPGEPALPGAAVQALVATKDGSLWVGLQRCSRTRAHPARTRHGATGATTASPRAASMRSSKMPGGRAGRAGLFRFDHGRWTRVPVATAEPPMRARLQPARRSAPVRPPGGQRRGRVHARRGRGSPSPSSDASRRPSCRRSPKIRPGTVWVGHTERIVASLTEQARPTLASDVPLPTPGWRLLARRRRRRLDRRASAAACCACATAWCARRRDRARAATSTRSPDPRARSFRTASTTCGWACAAAACCAWRRPPCGSTARLAGLTNDGVRALTARRDGSVWVATGHNLNVLRRGDRTPPRHPADDGAAHRRAGPGRAVNARRRRPRAGRPLRAAAAAGVRFALGARDGR